MLRTSPTTLESFRLFKDPEQEWMTEARFLESLRGQVTETPELRAGRAFDNILQAPERYRDEDGLGFSCEGVFFPATSILPALALFPEGGVWQVKAQKAYGDVLVVTKADFLHGAQLVENKTTGSSFSFDKYEASAQWRFMADIFEPRVITYRVFLLEEHADGAEYSVRDTHSFNLFPYETLGADCQALVDDFRDYVRRRGLEPLLQAKHEHAEQLATL